VSLYSDRRPLIVFFNVLDANCVQVVDFIGFHPCRFDSRHRRVWTVLCGAFFMSGLYRPRTTIRQLVLIGCLLISIPLIYTIFNTIFRIETLSRYLQDAVANTTDAVDASRLVVSATRDLERSAGQYLVLKDQDVLARYEQQRHQLALARTALYDVVPEDTNIHTVLNELSSAERALFNRVNTAATSGVSNELKPEELSLGALVQDLPDQVNALVYTTTREVNDSVQSMIKRLFWQAIMLVPLFVLLAFVFSYLVTKPMRSMVRAVRRLGEGDFNHEIIVDGPRDMRDLGQRLEWLRNRLAEIDQQKLTFLHHVSHELKTPLTSIREGVGLLEEEVVGALNQEQQKVAGIIKDNSIRLQEEVEALLSLNNDIETNPAALENLELSMLVQETATQQRLAARARGVGFNMKMEKIIVSGDWQQLRTLVGNLLSNAIKYSPNNSVIKIRLGALRGAAALDVIDQGIGIDMYDKDKIFEPFYQGSRAAGGHIKGTGLGLAIAYQYAQSHHGSLQLIDCDQGAHFRLTLPLCITGETHAARA